MADGPLQVKGTAMDETNGPTTFDVELEGLPIDEDFNTMMVRREIFGVDDEGENGPIDSLDELLGFQIDEDMPLSEGPEFLATLEFAVFQSADLAYFDDAEHTTNEGLTEMTVTLRNGQVFRVTVEQVDGPSICDEIPSPS